MRLSITLAAFAILILTSSIHAQQPSPGAMTIAQAVDSALKTYPSISVSQEQINAAAAAIDLARTSYLPRIDTLATDESRNKKQCVWIAAAPKRDSLDFRTGAGHEWIWIRLGKRCRSPGDMGTV